MVDNSVFGFVIHRKENVVSVVDKKNILCSHLYKKKGLLPKNVAPFIRVYFYSSVTRYNDMSACKPVK